MTNEEKQEIVNEVLAALATHGKTIDQLTPVTSPSDEDSFELSGGKSFTYGRLMNKMAAAMNEQLEGYVDGDALMAYINQYLAKLDTNGALNWQESPIVMLATMGSGFDDVDGELPEYTLQEGDMFYNDQDGWQIHKKKSSGSEGMPAKQGVVYFNMRTWRTYKWTGTVMVEIAKPKNRVVLANLHTQNYNTMTVGTIAYNPTTKKIVEKYTTGWKLSDPDPDYIYCDAQTNTLLRWDATTDDWAQVGGGGGSVLKEVTFEDGNLIFTFETEQGEQVITVPIEFDASNYVPITRTINGKALSQDIVIGQSDISGLVAALAALVPQSRTINGKALSSNVTIGMSDIQGLVEAIANAGSGAVSVTTNQDGTFVIHVGSTDYTINLNHTHEGMAKLVVCEESDLPSTLDEDTIYGVEEDGEIAMLYVGGVPFYGGGGSSSEPALRQPSYGSTIDVGTIASGQSSVTKTITVKGKNLTQALTVAVTGTGYSVDKQSISAADANVGTTLTITCTNTAENAAGTLSIASSEVSCDCDLVGNMPTYENLAAVKTTGTQYLDTGYMPKNNTILSASVKFIDKGSSKGSFSNCIEVRGSTAGKFYIYIASASDNFIAGCAGAGNGNSHLVDGSPYGSVRQLSMGDGHFSVDGSSGAVGTTPNFTDKTLCIGGAVNHIFDYADFEIHNVKIYEGSTLVRDYSPVTKNGSIPGLLDAVTGVFISSETSDELVAIPLS